MVFAFYRIDFRCIFQDIGIWIVAFVIHPLHAPCLFKCNKFIAVSVSLIFFFRPLLEILLVKEMTDGGLLVISV